MKLKERERERERGWLKKSKIERENEGTINEKNLNNNGREEIQLKRICFVGLSNRKEILSMVGREYKIILIK